MITIYESEESQNNYEPEEGIEMLEKKPFLFNEIPKDEKRNSYTNLTPYIEDFLRSLDEKIYSYRSKGEPTVQVSEVLGGLARIYEKIRTTVEYKGDHVLRRNAIERILKRLIWEQQSI